MLTPKQRDLLLFIDAYCKANGGTPPTRREMANASGVHVSNMHRVVTALVEKGYLERLPRQARALQVVRMPGETDVLDQLTKAIRNLEHKAGTTYAVQVLADIARDMLDRGETALAVHHTAGNA